MDFFEFNKSDFDYIIEQCMLDEEYKKILEYKIKGYSIVRIALELNMSESTVNRKIKQLKKKIMKVL